MTGAPVVIVGGGQGGFQVAASLRQGGYDGAVQIVHDEPGLPYQRPPLSKAYLKDGGGPESVALRPAVFYADNAIELIGPVRATAIDRPAKTLVLADGRRLPYGHLVLATGARNRLLPFPGSDLDGVFYLRSLAEAEAVRRRLPEARRAVVVGAGFIGLEFAATARGKGLTVDVVEIADRPMARALSPDMSAHFAAWHARAGATIRFGAGLAAILGEGGRVAAVELSDGTRIEADMVVAGIGVVPNTELASEAGLEVENGIVVDEHLLTADPSISAIGDCASFPCRYAAGTGLTRLESVQNATDQGKAVAARLLGRPAPYAAVPWFWSDQGDNKLQMVGMTAGYDKAVIRGDAGAGQFSVFCYRDGDLVGIESVNRAGDHMAGRRLLAAGRSVAAKDAADPAFDLKRAAM